MTTVAPGTALRTASGAGGASSTSTVSTPVRSKSFESRRRSPPNADRHHQEAGLRPWLRIHRRRGREGVLLPPHRPRHEPELRLPHRWRASHLRDRAEPEGPPREPRQARLTETLNWWAG